MKNLLAVTVLGSALLSAGAAKADVMQVDFLGSVSATQFIDGIQFQAGDRVRARFSYESAVVANNLNFQHPGFYQYYNANSAVPTNPILLSSSLVNLTTNSGPVMAHNYYSQFNQGYVIIGSGAQFEVVDYSAFDNGGANWGYRNLLASTLGDGIIQSLTQTGDYLTAGTIYFESIGASNQLFTAELTELIITSSPSIPVPEPASMLLLGAGLLGVATVRRRKPGKS